MHDVKFIFLSIPSADEDPYLAAVTKIQAIFRGRFTRKMLLHTNPHFRMKICSTWKKKFRARKAARQEDNIKQQVANRKLLVKRQENETDILRLKVKQAQQDLKEARLKEIEQMKSKAKLAQKEERRARDFDLEKLRTLARIEKSIQRKSIELAEQFTSEVQTPHSKYHSSAFESGSHTLRLFHQRALADRQRLLLHAVQHSAQPTLHDCSTKT